MAKFPRRRDEYRVVHGLWEGLSDEKVKEYVEEEMEYEGWSWEVIRDVISRLVEGEERKKEAERLQQENRISRKKRKRRFIPLVWPSDDEFDGLGNSVFPRAIE